MKYLCPFRLAIYTSVNLKVMSAFWAFIILLCFSNEILAQCGNISNGNCPSVVVNLPFQLNFTGNEGGLKDSLNQDVGFRMVQSHSQARLTADLPQSYPGSTNMIGYERKKFYTQGGNLLLRANRGTTLLKPNTAESNTQVNALGVGLQQTNKEFIIETTLINPSTGGNGAYTGIWYGLDEDNYVRLSVNNNGIEFRIEKNGVSPQGDPTFRIFNNNLINIQTSRVVLKLVVNNILSTKTVKAFYQVGVQQEVEMGTFTHTFHDGITLPNGTTQNVSFAGIVSSYRTGTTFTSSFDYFNITPVAKGFTFNPKNLNVSVDFEGANTTASAVLEPRGENPGAITLSKSGGTSWLILPANPVLGQLDFSINVAGLMPGTYTGIVKATATGFADGELKIILKVVPKDLDFSVATLDFSVLQNGNTAPQFVELIPEIGSPFISLKTGHQGNWLTLPANPSVGMMGLNVNAQGLLPGMYQTTLTASAAGYKDAILTVNLTVTELALPTINWLHRINFQTNTAPPAGWVRDIGEAYGNRGSGRTYGWVDPASKLPKNNTAQARNRTGVPYPVELRTLNQFQVVGSEVNWEMALPNGAYYIQIASGDSPDANANSYHLINAEGQKIIDFNQAATGVAGFQTITKLIYVQDGKLTLDAFGGVATRINYIWIGTVATANDNIAPSASFKFEGVEESAGVYRNQVKITIDTTDLGGSGINLVEFSLNGADYQSYQFPLFVNEVGKYQISAKVRDRNNNLTTTPYYSFEVIKPTPRNVRMAVENVYKFPDNDNYTFSFIQTRYGFVLYGPNYEHPDVIEQDNYNHDSNEIRLRNLGNNPLIITKFLLSDMVNFRITRINGVNITNIDDNLPLVIQPNSFVDITVIFATRNLNLSAEERIRIFKANITIESNDDFTPVKKLGLHAIYNERQEGSNEPTTQEMIDASGMKTNVAFNQTNQNHAFPIGDEVFTSYFVRADLNKPVYVRQIGSYHTLNSTEAIRWWRKGSTVESQSILIFRHTAKDSQTLLPRRQTTLGLGEGTFNNTFGGNNNIPFSFRISQDDTDPLRNGYYLQYPALSQDANGNPFRGARVWKAVNPEGKIIPNAYLIAHDYLRGSASGPISNFDYNDNLYYVENIRPEVGTKFYSDLATGNGVAGSPQEKQSSLEFANTQIGSETTITLNLRNLGETYPNGTIDPNINITKIEIQGLNFDEFSASNPLNMSLGVGNATTMTVKFKPVTVGIKNAVLLIYHNFASSPLRVPLFGLATSPCYNITLFNRYKAGSNANMTVNGKTWLADNAIRKGAVKLDACNGIEVNLTDDDPVYCSYLSSTGDGLAVRHEIPLGTNGSGKYLVRIHFTENFFSAPNRRVNNIFIEDELRLFSFDIFSEIGYKNAIVKDFEVNVADNLLKIEYVPLVNRPAVSAIEIYKITSNSPITLTTEQITPSACSARTGSIQVKANNVANGVTVSYKLGKYGVYQASNTFNNLSAGEYTIYVKENTGNGCEASATFVVPQDDSFITYIINKTPANCDGTPDGTASIQLIEGGVAPYAIQWNTFPIQTGNTAIGLADGEVFFTITDATGCTKTGSVTIDFCVETPNTPPVLVNPIPNINVFKNASNTIINLIDVFEDADGDPIIKSVVNNTNTGLVTTNLVGNTLTLLYTPGLSGIADITIRGTDTKGDYADDQFRVTVTEVNIEVTQINREVLRGRKVEQILRIRIDNPTGLNLTSNAFKFNITGTSSPASILKARLYQTAGRETFTTPIQLGADVNNPTGEFTITGFNRTFINGANYFWIAYDIDENANLNEVMDATLVSVTLKGTEVFPNDGNPFGNRLVRKSDERPGNALEFDGENDYVAIPDEARYDFTNAMTVEAWIKVDAFTKTRQAIVTKGNTWALQRRNSATLNSLNFSFNYGANQTANVNGATAVNDGEWHHVAAVFTGTQAILYVDGKEDGKINLTTTINTSAQPVYIGANAQLANKFFDGKIDEVRIWNIARSQNQIRESMHLTLKGSEDGLVSYWQMNEEDGLLAKDYVGSADGILNGMDEDDWDEAEQPIGGGKVMSANVTNAGTTNFDEASMRITFGNTNPNGGITITRIDNVSPAGDDPAPGKVKTSSYWVINNYGTNISGLSPMTLRFYVPNGFLTSANPSDYTLHKRNSNADNEPWLDNYTASEVNINEKYIEFSGVTSFSQAIISGTSIGLPIRLLSFSGKRTNDAQVELKWVTALEENNKGFEIEKGKDGLTFQKIGFLDGAGDSNQQITYSWTDESAQQGAYYRLKQVDFDGTFSYSPIVFVNGSSEVQISIYPNPVSDIIEFNASESLQKNETLRAYMTNMKGEILTEVYGNLDTIKQRLQESLPTLANGLYIVRLVADGKPYTLKFIKR